MIRKPSDRRRSQGGAIQLNLVPMLDALITMIAFLLYTITFFPVTMHDSPIPIHTADSPPPQTVPLQLTLRIEGNILRLSSPFARISERVLSAISTVDGEQMDLDGLKRFVSEIRTQFPTEKTLVVLPDRSTPYEGLIRVLDAVRPSLPEVVIGNLNGGGA